MTDTTESRWFKIIVFLLSAAVIGVTIANIIYYNKIRNGTCGAVTHGEATTMLWVNVILLIVAIFVFIWSIWKLLFTHDTRKQVSHYMVSPDAGMNMGYQYAPAIPVATSTDESAMVTASGEQNFLAQAGTYL